MTHQKVCGRFAGAVFLIHVSDISAHGLADFEDAGAGVVDSYILDEYLRSWDQKCRPDKIGSRRNISRHENILGVKLVTW